MSKKLTIEEFIRRARLKHGDKYDYSKVEYKGSKNKVCIICPIHGEFWQTPNDHLFGYGCWECGKISRGKNRRLTQDEFIAKAREVHGDKYDYSKVNYKNSHTKVCIICPIHGEFWQEANSHLQGHGCPECSGCKKKDTEQFIQDARKVHGDWYDYGMTDYKDAKTPVYIICPKHGGFWQTPNSHLLGCGCKDCGYERNSENFKSNTEEFIAKSTIVHGDRFDYSQTEYIDANTPVKIVCRIHGTFWQRPADHLNGRGCPHCRQSCGERDVMKWLDDHSISYKREYCVMPPQVLFGRNKFFIDFYLPDHNTFIEFHGGQHYLFVPFIHKTEDRFADQQDRDRRLREYCKQHKIRLIEIPYTEIDNIDNILTKKILKSKKI